MVKEILRFYIKVSERSRVGDIPLPDAGPAKLPAVGTDTKLFADIFGETTDVGAAADVRTDFQFGI